MAIHLDKIKEYAKCLAHTEAVEAQSSKEESQPVDKLFQQLKGKKFQVVKCCFSDEMYVLVNKITNRSHHKLCFIAGIDSRTG